LLSANHNIHTVSCCSVDVRRWPAWSPCGRSCRSVVKLQDCWRALPKRPSRRETHQYRGWFLRPVWAEKL